MSRLDRALLREAVPPFVALLSLAVALLVANRLLKVLPWLFEVSLPTTRILGVLLWLVPSFVLFALPIATWVAWVVAYGRLGVDGELTAWASVGAAPRTLLRAGLAAGLLLTLAAVATAHWGYGPGRLKFQEGLAALTRETALAALAPGTVARLGDTTWVAVAPAAGAKRTVYVVREPDAVLSALSTRPLSDAVGIDVGDGVLYARSATIPTLASFTAGRLEFHGIAAVLPEPSPRELDLRALWNARHERDAAVELHQRLALCLSLLLVPLAAFAVAPRRQRLGRGRAGLTAIVGLTLYYAIFTAGKQAALEGWLAPAVGVWLANATTAALALAAVTRRARRPGLP